MKAKLKLFEISVLAALFLLFVIELAFAFLSYKTRSFDELALKKFRSLKLAVLEEYERSRQETTYSFNDISDGARLGQPFTFLPNSLEFNNGLKLIHLTKKIVKNQSKPNRLVISFALYHERGQRLYRYVSVDGIVEEQVVKLDRSNY